MVDLTTQYQKIKPEIDSAMNEVVSSGQFINGKQVTDFCRDLSDFTGSKHIIPCGNGTDALQIALMASGLKEGDEVILPAFTYIAAIEAVVLLKLTPVLVDVDSETFNINPEKLKEAITPRTKAVIPVHLYGQSCDMEQILRIAQENNFFVIEDNAQSIGAEYTFSDGRKMQTGTMGDVGILSFFPTKNLACFGDGGAMMTQNPSLAEILKRIASHGQSQKYIHQQIGCNSRLDTLQAAVLRVKLKYLREYIQARQSAAKSYLEGLKNVDFIELPKQTLQSTHVFHQFTIKIKNGQRDKLKEYLTEHSIPYVVYYPLPVHKQAAYKDIIRKSGDLSVSEQLCNEVLSLPMHTELDEEQIQYIISKIQNF